MKLNMIKIMVHL